MSIRLRIKSALVAACWHLLGSGLVAAISAVVVFKYWYPTPYDALAGGLFLWFLMVLIDVVCGPLLTLVVFDKTKPRGELLRDLGGVVLIQIMALVYGMYSVAQARPVYLAYEGNRFRLVSVADVDLKRIGEAPPEFQVMRYSGPILLGVKLIGPSDPDYRKSILQSVQGFHPAFRPDRWVAYSTLQEELQNSLKPISLLKVKHPDKVNYIDEIIKKHGVSEMSLGYLPLDAVKASPPNWIVIVDRGSGEPRAFLPLDGW